MGRTSQEDAQIEDRKVEQIRDSLAPTVRMVRQLGIDTQEALTIFGGMLDEGAGVPPRDEEGAE